MMFRLLVLLVFLTAPAAYAQDQETDWINDNAYELKADSASGSDDLRFLSEELKDRTVVGLGEATHGTREFFAQKRRIIESIVSQHGFRLLAFEFTDAALAPVNQYLQSGQGDLRQLMQPLRLYNTEELHALFRWIRQHNSTKPAQDRVVL
jgi:erythromycin esterase-like protein